MLCNSKRIAILDLNLTQTLTLTLILTLTQNLTQTLRIIQKVKKSKRVLTHCSLFSFMGVM